MEPSDSNLSLKKPSRKGTEKSSNPPQNLEEAKENEKKLSTSSRYIESMTDTKKIYEKITNLYELNETSLEKNRKLALALNILKKETDEANTLRRQLESRLDKKINNVNEKVENALKDVNDCSTYKNTSESDLNFLKNKCKQLEKNISAIEEVQKNTPDKEYIAEVNLSLVQKFEGLEKKFDSMEKKFESLEKKFEGSEKKIEDQFAEVKKNMFEMEIRQEKFVKDKLELFEQKIFQQLEKLMSYFNLK